MKIFTESSALSAGKWYAVGMQDLDGDIFWGGAPIYKYDGGGLWSDEGGEPIASAWDTALQMSVNINGADAYMQQ